MLDHRQTSVAVMLVVLGIHSSDCARLVGKEIIARKPNIRSWAVTLIDDETKLPLSGIAVTVNGATEGNAEPQSMTLTSDSAGKVEIPIAAGEATIVNVREPGWWTGDLPLVGEFDWDQDGKIDGPKRTDDHVITLWRGTEVKGKLLTPAGKPAAGVALNAGVYINNEIWLERMGRETGVYNSWDHGDWPNWETSRKTEKDGTFSITVPPHDARTWVRVGTGGLGFHAIDTEAIARKHNDHALVRYAPFEVEVNGWTHNKQVEELQGVLDLGTLQLEEGIVLKGRVLDADGQPLSNVHLNTSSRHGPYAGRKTVSQTDGSFEFSPMKPGTFTLSPDARLRDEHGEVNSRDVQAVFIPHEVTLSETAEVVELTVQAIPHVNLEFEWVDRRAKKGPVSYYGEFALVGFVPRAGSKPVWWRGATEKISRDGQELLAVKVPRDVTDVSLYLPADQRVTASYKDDNLESGPGHIKLGDVTKPMRRVIYGDEPRPENAQRSM